MGSLLLKQPLRYRPHITIGLQNLSVYWLTIQSNSVAVMAEVPTTIFPSTKTLSHVLFLRQCHVGGIKLLQIVGIRHIARTDSTFVVIHYDIYCQIVISEEFVSLRQCVELLDLACSLTYTPAQKHIQLKISPLANSLESCNIECLSQSYHRHR